MTTTLSLPPIDERRQSSGRAKGKLAPPVRVQEDIIACLQARKEALNAKLAEDVLAAKGDEKVRAEIEARLKERDYLYAEVEKQRACLSTLRLFAGQLKTAASGINGRSLEMKDQINLDATRRKISRLENRLDLSQVRSNMALHQCWVSRSKILEALNDMSVFNRQYLRQAAAAREADALLGQLLATARRSLEVAEEHRDVRRRMEAAAPSFRIDMAELLRRADDELVRFLSRRQKIHPGKDTLARFAVAKASRRSKWARVVAGYLPYLDRARDMSPEDADRMRREFQEHQQAGLAENTRLVVLRRDAEALLTDVIRHLERQKARPVDDQLEARRRREMQDEAKARAMSNLLAVTLKGVVRMSRHLGCDLSQLHLEGGLSLENLDRHMDAVELRVRELHEQSIPPADDMLDVKVEAAVSADGEEVLEEQDEGDEPQQLPVMVMASCMERAERRRAVDLHPRPMDRRMAMHLLLSCEIVRSDLIACTRRHDVF